MDFRDGSTLLKELQGWKGAHSNPLPWADPLDQAAPSAVQAGLGHFQGSMDNLCQGLSGKKIPLFILQQVRSETPQVMSEFQVQVHCPPPSHPSKLGTGTGVRQASRVFGVLIFACPRSQVGFPPSQTGSWMDAQPGLGDGFVTLGQKVWEMTSLPVPPGTGDQSHNDSSPKPQILAPNPPGKMGICLGLQYRM